MQYNLTILVIQHSAKWYVYYNTLGNQDLTLKPSQVLSEQASEAMQ